MFAHILTALYCIYWLWKYFHRYSLRSFVLRQSG